MAAATTHAVCAASPATGTVRSDAVADRIARAHRAVEWRLAKRAAGVVALLAAPAVAVAATIGGARGARGAAIAAVIVCAVHLSSGAGLSLAATKGPGALMGAALAGYGVRLAAYAALIVALTPFTRVDGPISATALALATVPLMLVSLGLEARHVLRTPSTTWLQARPERRTAA